MMNKNSNFVLEHLQKQSLQHREKHGEETILFENATYKQQELIKEKYDLEININQDSQTFSKTMQTLKQTQVMLNNVVSNEDILVFSVAENINNLKKEIRDLKEKLISLEKSIEKYRIILEKIKIQLADLLLITSKYEHAWDKSKDVIENTVLMEKLSEYNDIIFSLQEVLGDVKISFLPELIDSQVIIKNFTIENNIGDKLDFNVIPETLYTTEDVCRGCNMGTISTYANMFNNIKESNTIYEFFHTIDNSDIHFDTFTELYGETCLRGIYFLNRNAESELEKFIKISTNYNEYSDKQINHHEVIISFCEKPTNF